MDQERFDLVYDGPSLSSHQMDARELGPALLSLGNLIVDANRRINSEKVEVKVLVDSEHKPGCFSLSLEIWQDVVDVTKSILGAEGIKTAKDILEWLDLLKPYLAVGVIGSLGLLGYYKVRAGRAIETANKIVDENGNSQVEIKFKGDNNKVIIAPTVYNLSRDPKIARDVKGVLAPLNDPGINLFYTRQANVKLTMVTDEDAEAIEASCNSVIEDPNLISTITIQAHLQPSDPSFMPDQKTWGFWFGSNHINADITSTSIAKDAVQARQVSMDDIYFVDLEIAEHQTPSGQIRHHYKITKVHEKTRGMRQGDMFDEAPQP